MNNIIVFVFYYIITIVLYCSSVTVEKSRFKLDPLYSRQYALEELQIPKVWEMGIVGSKEIRICIVDSGVDVFHPDLQENLWINPREIINGLDDDDNGIIDDIYGASFQNGIGSNNTIDDNGHGTMIAGIIAATHGNGIGITGIMQNASMISCKFLAGNGFGTVIDAILCVNYCISHNVSIINASWGSEREDYNLPDYTLEELERRNITLVAAGNKNYPMYPADSLKGHNRYRYKNIINTNMIQTPSEDIISTFPPHLYEVMSGESCGAAHITGCLGLLYSKSVLKTKVEPILINLTQGNVYTNESFDLYQFLTDLNADIMG